jgi:alginate O-acetyltransferase complex protein AlgI
MLFNSFEFLFGFLPIALSVFFWSRRRSPALAQQVLLFASLAFYAWWDWRFLPLLAASLVFNHAYGRVLARRRSRSLLWLGISANLVPLLWFKYAPWVLGHPVMPEGLQTIPLGISFFTFLQIAYLVGIWRGDHREDGFVPYAVFVTYFPHLIAGPILRLKEFAPQLQAMPRAGLQLDEQFARGLLLLLVGLFKKVVIADSWCAGLSASIFGAQGTLTALEAWTGALAYTCQLFADFSGYCEMALGMSLMMGLTIPLNFFSPYRSTSIAQFWRTWHMSLGIWFRDHVYIPLGGNRHGLARGCGALFLTMLLCGLWHGAGWTFILWGALHGCFLIAHRLWTAARLRMADAPAQLLTLLCVIIAWVVFRATSIESALAMLHAMSFSGGLVLPSGFAGVSQWLPPFISLAPSSLISGVEPILLLVLLWFFATAKNVHEINLQPTSRWAVALCAGAVVSVFAMNNATVFMYANF